MEHCPALRAYGWLRQLSFNFVDVINPFLKNSVLPGNLPKSGLNVLDIHGRILLSGEWLILPGTALADVLKHWSHPFTGFLSCAAG
ncbi:hypothetical protein [Nitrosomonas sp.]|uniref:hypothetical protein n=1 Tax=Nitrosomonas sp. TaxID=42353 RepID=UPI00343BD066